MSKRVEYEYSWLWYANQDGIANKKDDNVNHLESFHFAIYTSFILFLYSVRKWLYMYIYTVGKYSQSKYSHTFFQIISCSNCLMRSFIIGINGKYCR